MKLRTPYHIAKYFKHKIPIRSLTDNEILFAKSVFGDLVDYKTVNIVNYPYVFWQMEDILIAPNGQIFVGDKHYKDDFTQYGNGYKQLFIHEMTHVLQYQHGINVLWHGTILQSLYYLSFKKYNPYHYIFDKNKNFWDYNIEQQGKIAEHIYLGQIKNIIQLSNKNNNKSNLNICPHIDCGKTLNDVISHHGMLFCPHCTQSLLVNVFTSDLSQMNFWKFVGYFIKTQGKLYVVVFGIMLFFVLMIEMSYHFNKFAVGVGFWVVFFVIVFILMGVGIYKFEKNIKNYHYTKLKNKAILKGVDNYNDVKDDVKISESLENLQHTFDKFTVCCPHCHSQRLYQADNGFVCQNCHHQLTTNPLLKRLDNYGFMVSHILMLAIIINLGDNFYMLLLVVPLLFFINLIIQYYWFKTPKWQT